MAATCVIMCAEHWQPTMITHNCSLYSLRCCHSGDHLQLQVLRDGEVRELSYEVRSHKLLVPTLHGVDGCTPTYFTIAGLIFVPLSIPFLEHAYGGAYL